MAITPYQLDIYASQIAEIYQSLEGEIIRLIIERIMTRGIENIADWQIYQLQDLHLLNQETVKLLADVTKVAPKEIEKRFEQTTKETVKSVDHALNKKGVEISTAIDQIMQAQVKQAMHGVDNLINQRLVSQNFGTDSIVTKEYQKVLNRSASLMNTGIYTRQEAVEKAIQELAQKGLDSGFKDKAGRTWSVERYVQTTMKSTLNNTYNQIHTERMAELGCHTVLVTSHMGARDACSRIQGKVVDLRHPEEIPAGSKYKSIYDPIWKAEYGTAGGHRGVNCRHNHIPFVDGVNTNNQKQFSLEENKKAQMARTRQRELERRIVKYKKNYMVADKLNADDKDHWQSMIRKSQKAMRDHIAENDKYISRNYQREKVYVPLETLLKQL